MLSRARSVIIEREIASCAGPTEGVDIVVNPSGKSTASPTTGESGAQTAGLVLLTLCSAQFLMTLDASVMNVSIAQVASDLGTTVTGIQTAITLYTLVMATLMITGGKIGAIIGTKRAFAIGAVIYAAGSLTTALAPNLTVLYLGWSGLEGIGAALIMPAIVSLVATNIAPAGRARAYGLVAAAGAIAVAVGPLIGGLVTTYFSWRWVFVAEVVLAAIILVLARKITGSVPSKTNRRIDLVGTVLSVAGLGLLVFGVLRSSEWGWVNPKGDSPNILGMSMTLWFILIGLLICWLFFGWERRVEQSGRDPLIRVEMLSNKRLTGGLTMFGFQYLLQAGTFFIVPLFLTVVLGLNALETGVRLVPLSLALLVSAAGVPKVWPNASPRLLVRVGILLMLAGIVTLMSGIDLTADAAVVAIPLTLIGLGIGTLASQLGAVTVSSVPDSQSSEVGGLQNTATNLGASLGTALAGSVLIAVLTGSLISGMSANDQIPDSVKNQAETELVTGVPFLSDAQLREALTAADVPAATTEEVVAANTEARIEGLDAALGVLAIIAVGGLFLTRRIPERLLD